MKIIILCVGKLKEKHLKDAVLEYEKRLSPYIKLETFELADEKAPENLSIIEMRNVKEKEGARILSKISPKDFVVVLDLGAAELTSEAFSEFIGCHMQSGGGEALTFVIGGSLGLSDDIIRRANLRLSFSKMTLPHQLMRVVLLEQIYRGFKILRGEPYHK